MQPSFLSERFMLLSRSIDETILLLLQRRLLCVHFRAESCILCTKYFFYVFFLVRYILMYSFYYYAIYIMQIRDECMWILKKNLLKNIQWNKKKIHKKKIRSRNSNLYFVQYYLTNAQYSPIPDLQYKKVCMQFEMKWQKKIYLILFNIQLLSIITHIGFSLFPSPNCYILSILKNIWQIQNNFSQYLIPP